MLVTLFTGNKFLSKVELLLLISYVLKCLKQYKKCILQRLQCANLFNDTQSARNVALFDRPHITVY